MSVLTDRRRPPVTPPGVKRGRDSRVIVEEFEKQGRFPALSGREPHLVEAGGQHIRGFRRGLDYAFIRVPDGAWMRSVLSGSQQSEPDPSARPGSVLPRRVYESLQGRPEVGPLPTPRRCHAAL